MKNKLLFLPLLFTAFLTIGCSTPNKDQGQEHTHTYSESWTYDSTYHWHAATCGHDVVEAKAAHTLTDWVIDVDATETSNGSKHRTCSICSYREDAVIDKVAHVHSPGTPVEENRIEPGCETSGSYDLVTYCTTCLEEISSEHFTINPLGHNFGAPTYQWSIDHHACTARRVCQRDNNHVEEETASATINITTQPTFETEGVATYTANFENSAFATQEVEAPVEVKQHSYSDEWTYDESGHYHQCIDPGYEHLRIDEGAHHFSDVGLHDRHKCITIERCDDCGYEHEKITAENSSPDETLFNYSIVYKTYAKITPKDKELLSGTVVIPAEIGGYPVCQIPDYAFINCEQIETLVIQGPGIQIGENAFFSCDNLKTVIFASTFDYVNLGYENFGNCYKLQEFYVLNGRQGQHHSYDGILYNNYDAIYAPYVFPNNGHVNIKEGTVNILSYLFKDRENLKSVTIPDSVIEICERAFATSGLEEVEFGSGVRTIGNYAFSATKLREVIFPDSLRTIGEYAFSGIRPSLSSVTLNAGLTTINNGAFLGCYYLVTIINHSDLSLEMGNTTNGYVAYYAYEILNDPSETEFTKEDGFMIRLNPEGYVLYKYLGSEENITIPSGVVKIFDSAFAENATIKSVTCNDELKEIGDRAFYNCDNLETITFNEGLESVGDDSFYHNSNLKSVDFPDSLTSLGINFYACDLDYLHLPKNLTSFDNFIVYYGNIKSFHVSCPLDADFQFPSNIEKVKFDGNCKTLQLNYGISSDTLMSIEFGEGVENIIGPVNSTNFVKYVTFSNTVKSLSDNVLNGFIGYKVELPSSLTSVSGGNYSSNQFPFTVINHSSLDNDEFASWSDDVVNDINDSRCIKYDDNGFIYYKVDISDSSEDYSNYELVDYIGTARMVTNDKNFKRFRTYAFRDKEFESLTFTGNIENYFYNWDMEYCHLFALCPNLNHLVLPFCTNYQMMGDISGLINTCPLLTDLYINMTLEQWSETWMGEYNAHFDLNIATLHFLDGNLPNS